MRKASRHHGIEASGGRECGRRAPRRTVDSLRSLTVAPRVPDEACLFASLRFDVSTF
jgi:hypothetical protein